MKIFLIKLILLSLALMLVSSDGLFSQAPKGELVSYEIISGGDTVRRDRAYGDWWYGVYGGGQLLNYFGDAYIRTLMQTNNPFNRTIQYDNGGGGGGLFLGAFLEWKPNSEKWGGAVNFNFYDTRSLEGTKRLNIDSFYSVKADFSYLSVSPMLKYHLPIEGLHLNGGLLFDFMMSNRVTQKLNFDSQGGKVEQSFPVEFASPKVGVGMTFGFGYDFFIADFYQRARILFTPFAEVTIRSSVVNDNNSGLYATSGRFGFAIKFGSDKLKIDTMYYDPTYNPPPAYLATVQNDFSISVSASIDMLEFPVSEIALVDDSEVQSDVSVVAKSDEPEKRVAAQVPAPTPKPASEPAPKRELIVRKSVEERFSYSTSSSVQVPPDVKKYLDKVAEFAFLNPNATIYVVGHSDDRGTFEQNATRAMERAKNVEKYLLSLNVPQSRIIASWKGSLFSVAPNSTEEGRRQNRRVEIIVE